MNEPVLAIEAAELLEWLREMKEGAIQERDTTTIDTFHKQCWGYILALEDVIMHVEGKAFLMSKEREISIQEKLEGEKND